MPSIKDNLTALQYAIAKACETCGRDVGEITLVGAAKTKTEQAIRTAFACGVTDIGENYLQEARRKIPALCDLPITWHYIGAIQSNKTRQIAELFDWVHTIERASIAERLSNQCPTGKSLNVLLQVNVDRDTAKAGVDVTQVHDLLESAQALPNLNVRGLMTILAEDSDPRASYETMAQLFADLSAFACSNWDTLSMGMTADMDVAIQSGATHIRIGTALFGARD